MIYSKLTFRKYNKLVFNNSLIEPTFRLLKDKDNFALLDYTNKNLILYINLKLNLTRKDIHDTILHEMIHIWQYQKGLKVNHGYTFQQARKWLNEYFNLKVI